MTEVPMRYLLLASVVFVGCASKVGPYGITEFDTKIEPETPVLIVPPVILDKDQVHAYPVTMYWMDGCMPCEGDKKRNGKGDKFVTIQAVHATAPHYYEVPKGIPLNFPIYTWRDDKGDLRYHNGAISLKDLRAKIDRNNTKVEAKRPSVNGPIADLDVSGKISEAISQWEKHLGEGTKIHVTVDRTGCQLVPFLGGVTPRWQEIVGKLCHIKVETDAPLPIKAIGAMCQFKEDAHGGDILEFLPDKIEYNLTQQEQVANDGKVGFIGMGLLSIAGSITSLISLGEGMWSLFHPQGDITLPGTMEFTATLKNKVIYIDFETKPQINVRAWFIHFAPAIRRAEVSAKQTRLLFEGSVVRERTIKYGGVSGVQVGAPMHSHTCNHSGTQHKHDQPNTWVHDETSNGLVADHICSVCGKVLWEKDK